MLAVLLLVGGLTAAVVGVLVGRFWQRHEHRPHWDELARAHNQRDRWKERYEAERQAHDASVEAHKKTAARADVWHGRAMDYAADLANLRAELAEKKGAPR